MESKKIWIILTISLCFMSQFAQAQLYELFKAQEYTHESGKKLLYRFLEPSVEIKSGEKFPLIIFLHGSGERGDNNKAQLVHVMKHFVSIKMRNKYPCYVMAPQCPKNEWWTNATRQGANFSWEAPPSDIEKSIIALIDDLVKEKNIDPNRIYLMGLSMGGFGTWHMLAHYPDKFAAAVPICGGGDPTRVEPVVNVPTWVFHGADDPVVPPSMSRDMVKAIQEKGGNPIYTEFEGIKHNSWDYAFDENPFVYDWLFSQRKK